MARISKAREDLISLLNTKKLLTFGVEVGVQEADFSARILDKWEGECLFMVDAWRHFENYQDIANVEDNLHSMKALAAIQKTNKWKDKRCIICETSTKAAEMFPDNYFDFVYLDAAHDEKSVTADLEAWYPKLRKGGVMCGDDYTDDHNQYAVFGVKSAVTKFRPNHNVINIKDEVIQWWFEK